jgi:HlyD family secretion protein/epimerase transport system membrane fusion protein
MTMKLLPAPEGFVARAKSRTDTGPWIVIGIAIVFITFGVFGTWAGLAKLASSAMAPGVVAVDSDWRTVQHLEGGIVAAILVKDGDHVNAGDVLLRLDPTRSNAQLNIIDGQLDLARATEARLVAERDDAPQIDFPDSLTSRMDNEDVATVVAGQQLLFKARRASIQGQIAILNKKIAELNEQIQGLQVQQDSRKQQYDLIEQELTSLQDLFKKGYVTRDRILQLQRDAESLRGQRGQDLADIASAQNQIGEAQLQILQTQKDFSEKVVDELREVQAQIYDLEEKRVAAADEVSRIDIKAPVSGRVLGMSVHTVGGVIRPGEDILNIVPEDDELIVQAKVRPEDIEHVARGQTAQVRFTGLSHRTAPVLLGEVITVSADRISDRSSASAATSPTALAAASSTTGSYYEVRIAISDQQLKRITDTGQEIVPGMPAEVMIETGKRTLLGFLLAPITDNFTRALAQ